MALKDRLEARRQGADGATGDGHLTVIEGMRSVPPVPVQQAGGQDDSGQKSTRTPLAFAAVSELPERIQNAAPVPETTTPVAMRA